MKEYDLLPVKFNKFDELKIFYMKSRSWLLPQQGMWLCFCWQFLFFTVPSNSLCACKMCVFDNTLMCMWGKSSLSKSRGVAISHNINLISWHFRKSYSVTDVFTFGVTSWQICSYMVCVCVCAFFFPLCACVCTCLSILLFNTSLCSVPISPRFSDQHFFLERTWCQRGCGCFWTLMAGRKLPGVSWGAHTSYQQRELSFLQPTA